MRFAACTEPPDGINWGMMPKGFTIEQFNNLVKFRQSVYSRTWGVRTRASKSSLRCPELVAGRVEGVDAHLLRPFAIVLIPNCNTVPVLLLYNVGVMRMVESRREPGARL